MSKTYRLVWGKRHHTFVAGAELLSARGNDGGGESPVRPAQTDEQGSGSFITRARFAGAAPLTITNSGNDASAFLDLASLPEWGINPP
ncbi:hypothetical protein [Cupriavidus sp. TMH.W2]|uniref:hypothetical protein n=1 Tax=Cupriavidus sp. TMH.W2 TaxID=3434465 RepID=UPI003D7880AD